MTESILCLFVLYILCKLQACADHEGQDCMVSQGVSAPFARSLHFDALCRSWSLWSDCSCECFGIQERSKRIAGHVVFAASRGLCRGAKCEG